VTPLQATKELLNKKALAVLELKIGAQVVMTVYTHARIRK
jgi:hypothetical protein